MGEMGTPKANLAEALQYVGKELATARQRIAELEADAAAARKRVREMEAEIAAQAEDYGRLSDSLAKESDARVEAEVALAAARRKGLEEAAARVDALARHYDGIYSKLPSGYLQDMAGGREDGAKAAAQAIRTLTDQPAPSTATLPAEPSEALVTVPASDLRRVLETLDDLAPYPVLPDHACVECVPYSDMIVPGFQCSRHRLAGLLGESRKS